MNNVKSKYKLVALDIDGTTVNKHGVLTKETTDTIRKVVKMGIPVCLVTGRNVHNAKKISDKLKVKTPVVCADGSVIYDPISKKNVYERVFSKEQLKEILEITDRNNVYVEMCSDKHYYQYIKTKELGKYNYGGSPNNVMGKLQRIVTNNVRYVKNIHKFVEKEKKINQLIFAGATEDVQRAKAEFIAKNYDNLQYRDDLWDNVVFIIQKNANKASGVKLLLKHYGYKMEEVIAMGDEMNDIDMITHAGLGIAVGNAHQRIKDAAKFVTLTNDENGVAYALNKFIINGEDVI